MLDICRCGSSKWETLVYFVVFLYYTGENVIVNTALPFISYSVCRHDFLNLSMEDCKNIEQDSYLAQELQKSAAFYYMLEKIISFIPPLLLAAFFGPWSDLHGRKLPFLVPYLGNMAAGVMFLGVQFVHSAFAVNFVMVSFLVRAFSGHFILLRLISFSYITDLVHLREEYTEIGMDDDTARNSRYYTDVGRKTRRGVPVEVAGGGDGRKDQSEILTSMCRLQVCDSMGSVVGAGLAWALQKLGGQALALSTGAGVLLEGVLVIMFCLRNFNGQGKVDESSGVLTTCFKKMTGIFLCGEVDVDRKKMWGCVLIVFLMMGCLEGRDSIIIPYVQDQPLSWPSRRYSAYVASYSLFQSVFLLVLAPMMEDYTVVVVSLLCSVAGGLWMAFSTTTWSMMLAGCFSHMTDCIFPAVKAILNKDLKLDQVGKVLSRISLTEALSIIVGPLLIVHFYEYTQSYFPGLAFLASSAIPAVTLCVGILIELTCPVQPRSRGKQFLMPELEPREVANKPDFTQSLNIPSATVSGYGFLWCSSDW